MSEATTAIQVVPSVAIAREYTSRSVSVRPSVLSGRGGAQVPGPAASADRSAQNKKNEEASHFILSQKQPKSSSLEDLHAINGNDEHDGSIRCVEKRDNGDERRWPNERGTGE